MGTMNRYDVISDLGRAALARYDLIIDARSPDEFEDDHLPGAINLPVLSNEQRAQVGTLYKQVSPFEARRKGASLVAANIATHIQTALADKPRDFKPAVYCWRGGMRSNSFATILAAVGWRTAVVEGGYKSWRRAVTEGLATQSPALELYLIDGQTGSAKTALLHELARRGAQMIDLEGLARHRGSAFGALDHTDQPSQKAFESALWSEIERLDPARPVFVEAESARVGRCRIPAALWAQMKSARRIEIQASAQARAHHTLERYTDMVDDPARIFRALDQLVALHGTERVEDWKALARSKDYLRFAERLIEEHYDPAYKRARKREGRAPIATITAERLDQHGLGKLSDEVLAVTRDSAP